MVQEQTVLYSVCLEVSIGLCIIGDCLNKGYYYMILILVSGLQALSICSLGVTSLDHSKWHNKENVWDCFSASLFILCGSIILYLLGILLLRIGLQALSINPRVKVLA